MESTPRTYERLTVNLTERSIKSVVLAAAITGDSKTDMVNRALQLYAYVMNARREGKSLILREPGGEETCLEFL